MVEVIFFRQSLSPEFFDFSCAANLKSNVLCCKVSELQIVLVAAVSYTHLTLPTILLV